MKTIAYQDTVNRIISLYSVFTTTHVYLRKLFCGLCSLPSHLYRCYDKSNVIVSSLSGCPTPFVTNHSPNKTCFYKSQRLQDTQLTPTLRHCIATVAARRKDASRASLKTTSTPIIALSGLSSPSSDSSVVEMAGYNSCCVVRKRVKKHSQLDKNLCS